MGDTRWPPAKAKALARLMAQGLTSGGAYREMRVKFRGTTRSGVIGFASRQGWKWQVPGQDYTLRHARVRVHAGLPPRSRDHTKSVYVRMDIEQHAEVMAVANRYNVSNAEAVRMLVDWALEGASLCD